MGWILNFGNTRNGRHWSWSAQRTVVERDSLRINFTIIRLVVQPLTQTFSDLSRVRSSGGTRHKPKNACALSLGSCQEWSNVRKVSCYQNATNPESSRRPHRNERLPRTVRIFASGCLLSSVIYKGISVLVQNSPTGFHTLKRKSISWVFCPLRLLDSKAPI